MFEQSQRIVIKVGSALLVDKDGQLQLDWLTKFGEDVKALKAAGKEVTLVTSGSVAIGKHLMGTTEYALTLEEKQAAAACGQPLLIDQYRRILDPLDIGLILLTLMDCDHRRRFMNASKVIDTLLERGIVPIVNENDTVTTEEIRVGDNDRLAARVAQMAEAEILVLLSDIDGLYTANPNRDPEAEHIPVVDEIDDGIEAMAGGSITKMGTGGMVTKIDAAKIATGSGCDTIIALGKVDHPIQALIDGGKHTRFRAKTTPHNARKQWIVSHLQSKGSIRVDAGAVNALKEGNSLLPVGITAVEGHFERGDTIAILDAEGKQIGCGLSAFSHGEVLLVMGKRNREIPDILNYEGRTEVIHRNDLVLGVL